MGNLVVNPVGIADIKQVEIYLQAVLKDWETYVTKNWKAVVNFFLVSIDYVVIQLDAINLLGADKKATVLQVASQLYDTVVPNMLPILLKPFNTQIKKFLFDVVLNVFIDYIVSKNNSLKGV